MSPYVTREGGDLMRSFPFIWRRGFERSEKCISGNSNRIECCDIDINEGNGIGWSDLIACLLGQVYSPVGV